MSVRNQVSSASETVPYISVEDRDDSNLYGRPEPKAFSSRVSLKIISKVSYHTSFLMYWRLYYRSGSMVADKSKIFYIAGGRLEVWGWLITIQSDVQFIGVATLLLCRNGRFRVVRC